MRISAEWDKAEYRGLLKGLQQGLEQGLEQGLQQDLEQGKQEERLAVAGQSLE
ncbi:MAG: hypothetical protein RLZZ215_265 [Pseudomonadota bacterium]|jgi:flagellar biosynthesis/type III secretory pathway protein FliH